MTWGSHSEKEMIIGKVIFEIYPKKMMFTIIMRQTINHGIVFPERCSESLAVCMSHMDKLCSNFYAKDLSHDVKRKRLRCAWALTHPDLLFVLALLVRVAEHISKLARRLLLRLQHILLLCLRRRFIFCS